MARPLAAANPPNPWRSSHVELLGPAPAADLAVYEEQGKSILSKNDSPDLPFRWSLNPYRGCFHGCAYCYARPTHQYLDWGAGTDFERRIVVKTNAAELLREHFARRTWRRERVAFSGVTDCYQPIEASYGITRACLEACVEFRNPVGIITKGALVERDVDVLAELATRAPVTVWVSIAFAEDADGRAMDPFAALPSRRLETVRRLAAAGLEVGVSLSPLIPALNDHQVPAILERARDAGATRAFLILLRLPAEVEDVFTSRLRAAFPQRAEKVLSLLRATRGGRGVKEARFGHRMIGSGPRWELVQQLFETHCRRLGLGHRREDDDRQIAAAPRQGTLFS